MRPVVAAVLLALLLGACSDASDPAPVARPSATATKDGAAERESTKPNGPDVTNEALGASHLYVQRAMADLKRIGLWDKLTRDLFIINFDARLGRADVPRDGHLADAYFGAVVDVDEQGGSSCDVMFFTSAIADDLERWRTYYSQGLIADVPPGNLRQFWGSLMAHELGHCQIGPHGEPTAERWEGRARTLLHESKS